MLSNKVSHRAVSGNNISIEKIVSTLSEIIIALLTAIYLLPLDHGNAPIPDSNRVLSVVGPAGTSQLAHKTSVDHVYGSNLLNVATASGSALNEKNIPPIRLGALARPDGLAEPLKGDVVKAMREVSRHTSAGDRVSTRQASLLHAGTMRGFTLAQRRTPPLTVADYAALATYGANLSRIGVMLDVDAGLTAFSMSQAERDHMQTTVAMAEKFGFKVVITLTAGPFSADNQVVWGNLALQSSLAKVWAGIAAEFKGSSAIAGYELINEPREPRHRTGQPFNPQGADEWRPLSIKLITAIRSVDPNSIIVWMPSPGGAEKFWSGFNNPVVPLPFSNIVYSFHFYAPHWSTHQGVGAYPLNQPYPAGYRNDKAYLVDRLQYVKAFGEMHGVPIFVGEFGFNRNSPPGSRETWFEDCLELFEQYGWNWAVHAFRNWEGWDTEIGPEVPAYAAGPRRPDAAVITMLKRKFLLNP